MKNIILATDSYKLTHWKMYPEGTTHVYSYFESRKGAVYPATVFFGLQYLLHQLRGVVVTEEKIEQAAALCRAHLGNDTHFNRPMWEHILRAHGGRLPVEIKAVPEGTAVPTGNVLMTVVNTDPTCAALTNHLETFLTHVWAPSTVASLSARAKQVMRQSLQRSAETEAALPFMLHDFGYRGVSSVESAGIEGAGHLLHFLGTDTVAAMEVAMEHYHASLEGLAYSVPATEHSIMTAEGREGEAKVVEHLLTHYPTGILSVVADSYDIEAFVLDLIGTHFREQILARDGVFVVRPDSLRHPEDTPEAQMVWLAEALERGFGSSVNAKGYRVLNPKVRLLWGDGIGLDGIERILESVMEAGLSAENCVFGMGGGLLQKINRDTQRFAFKSSAQCRGGVWHDVFKAPKDEAKASKRGRLKLIHDESHGWQTVSVDEAGEDRLVTVFKDGEVMKEWLFDEVRARAAGK